ncbi:NAD(P)H-dependent oxidoreductase [Erythrobacter sp. SCSIO 43205]|uniref:FMN-dependent NADH-azoreductase n=1 Tax=Erythrobacter sp. SCSIO 43205 TaxID=2779361 RepID=UPI001CA9A48B|nr:NAD(P)H-dependent oxidoreductase [Erythrobacter sp. SCSIO 43205]UAB77522.1 NAD(P)H-dependent oxidoreductase [Erythrobacter sp. SCSIO 43205]
MSNILHITASIRGDDSVSTALGNALVAKLSESAATTVTRRDLAANDVPYQTWDRFNAGLTDPNDRDAEQQELAVIADDLIAELLAADTIVFSSPIYNFSVPATVKAWADLVARASTTFKYAENGPKGLLTGKKAYITIASGGTPVGSDMDFMSSWLEFFLNFLGITVVEVIAADGIMGEDADAKIEAAHDQIAKIAA